MITAEHAYREAKYRKKVEEVKKQLEHEIQKSIKAGLFTATIDVNTDVCDEIRTILKEELEVLGYKVLITNVNIEYKNAPVDQRPWYDSITVDFGMGETNGKSS